MSHRRGTLYTILLLAVVAISTSAVFVKLSSAPAAVIVTYRTAIATLVMLPILFFSPRVRKEICGMSGRQWGLIAVAGLFLAAHFLLWFESLSFTSLASSTVLVTLQPIFSFLGALLIFRERISRTALFGGKLAILGGILVGWGDFRVGGMAFWGDLLALTSAFMGTVYYFIGQHSRQSLSSMTYTLALYAFCTGFSALYVLSKGYALTGYPAADWLRFIGIAIIPTLLGQSVVNWLLKWLKATTVSVGMLSETFAAVVFGYLLFDEKVSIFQLAGGGFIIFGIVIYLRNERKEAEKQLSRKPDSFREVAE
ncbi:DMT family transporter [Paenibacillus faecis]|uniref:DMT family transporter n=1 Tax=Paenibacillus faecis TaxID=862114 RepID=UPI001BCF21B8|nr:DMT family transporter [Paenibacillus faecis]